MALPPIGSLKRAVDLLKVETDLFTLYLTGKPFHPAVESLALHRNEDATWVDAHLDCKPLSAEVGEPMISVFSPEQQKLVAWHPGEACAPLFFETQSYELVIEKKTEAPIEFYHDHPILRESVLPKGSRLLSGMLNFQNEVGYTELELRSNGVPIFRLQLELFPTKMDYKRDYQRILHEVNEQIYNLSFDFLRKTYQLTGLKETQNQTLSEFFAILQQVFHQLVKTIERIQAAPHHKLERDHRLVDAARVKKAGRENISFLSKRPHFLASDAQHGFLSIDGQRYAPTHALETKRHLSYDTAENRFVRWVLLRIQQKLRRLTQEIAKRDRTPDPLLQRKTQQMQVDITRLLKMDFLQVGPMRQMSITLVLQMAPGYREVYRDYLMLMKGLSIQSDLFRLSMKDLAQLYEYWCFLKIHQLLASKYELISQDLIKVNRSGLFVTLDKSNRARMKYRNPVNDEVFTLYYNALPPGDKSRTIGQQPDNVLSLKKQEASVEYKYVFDAKYRLNPAYPDTPYARDFKTPGPQEDDINTMHRYRDAIVCESVGNVKEFERSMFGAYVLFPYPNEEEYREHHFYKSIEMVNVGAFPFLPGTTKLMEAFLDEIVMDSPEKAYERSTRPRGTKEYYTDQLSGKTVLVGALSDKKQLDDALTFGFYHTPLSNVTDHRILTQLEYVAVYQSITKFGREEAGIRWVGRIKEWQVLPRSEIAEIPSRRGASSELYVKFVVEEWKPLVRPIQAGIHPIRVLLFTTKYMFDRALEVAELRLESDEDLRAWREERRRGRVQVQWDREDLDDAQRIVSIRNIND